MGMREVKEGGYVVRAWSMHNKWAHQVCGPPSPPLPPCLQAYQELLSQQNKMDFDDMLNVGLALLLHVQPYLQQHPQQSWKQAQGRGHDAGRVPPSMPPGSSYYSQLLHAPPHADPPSSAQQQGQESRSRVANLSLASLALPYKHILVDEFQV